MIERLPRPPAPRPPTSPTPSSTAPTPSCSPARPASATTRSRRSGPWRRIVEAAEEDILAKGLPPLTERNKPRTQGGAVARAAAEIGDFLGAKSLVAFTQSGDTARRLSRYRSPIPLLAFTPTPPTRAQLTLTWGVETFLGPHVDPTDEMVDQVDELAAGATAAARRATWSSSRPAPLPASPGSTNPLRVHHIGSAVSHGN